MFDHELGHLDQLFRLGISGHHSCFTWQRRLAICLWHNGSPEFFIIQYNALRHHYDKIAGILPGLRLCLF